MILLNLIFCIFGYKTLTVFNIIYYRKTRKHGKHIDIHNLITQRLSLLSFLCLTFQNHFFHIYMYSRYESYFIKVCVK